MNDNFNKTSLTDKILGKLKSGEFKMKPKVYFVLQAVLVVLGLAVAVLFALFLISFISFYLRANGILVLPVFGFRGFGIFLASLPWLLIIVAMLLVVVLEIMFKHFAFAYRRPILYSLAGILIIVCLGTFLIDRTPLHYDLFYRAQRGGLPVFGTIYRDFGMPQLPGGQVGVVASDTDAGFIIKTRRGETFNIIIGDKTRLPLGRDIGPNDIIMIMGEREDGIIEADGVIKIRFKDTIRSFPLPEPPPFMGPETELNK